MELLDSSMDKISDKVYNRLNKTIPEPILGKMTVAVSVSFFLSSSGTSGSLPTIPFRVCVAGY